MFDNEILSPNKKVKKIRKQVLRATQDEIAKGVCTKSNISPIENNKQKLTYFLATGIAKNFNRIAKEKNIDIKPITAEWLIEDEEKQANYIFERNILNELEGINDINSFEEKLNEAEDLIENYNISDDKKIKLYKTASLFYFDECIYSKSDEMCNIGIKICLNAKCNAEEGHFYATKARNNFTRGECKYALQQLEYAERINSQENDGELFDRIYFNKSIVYQLTKNYDMALKYLEVLKNKYKTTNLRKLLDIKMLCGNCFNDQHEFEKAEKEYISILGPAMEIKNKDLVSLTYRNLSELYFNQKKYKDAEISITESLDNNHGNRHLNHDLVFAAKVFESVNKDPEPYFLRALDICEKKDKENLIFIEEIIYKLAKIYEKREDEEKLDFIIEKSYELNIDYTLIFQTLSEYYRDRNRKKSVELSEKSINKHKEIKNF